jgi:hypothetical protein
LALTITNGPALAVIITDDLPNFTTFSSFTSGPTGTVSGTQLTWDLGTLAPGVYNFSFDVTVANNAPDGAILTNGASVAYQGGASSVPANGNNVLVVVLTPTRTATPTLTATKTLTVTKTPTFTSTPSATATTVNETQICKPYPNPSLAHAPFGLCVAVNGSAEVEMDVFTSNFRKVLTRSFQATGYSQWQWDLRDQWGNPVANGLYYIRVHVDASNPTTKIFKVLVLN